MSNPASNNPSSALGTALGRSMGLPIVSRSKALGASTSVYVDLFDLTLYPGRAFNGLMITNPDTSNGISIAIGSENAQAASERIYVPANFSLTFDDLTFGWGIPDQIEHTEAKRIRAALSATTGTAATGTIGYAATQPADGTKVTINGNVYEFLNNRNAGDGLISVLLGASADATYTALVAAVNSNDKNVVATINTGTDVVTITSNYSGVYPNTHGVFADGGAAGVNPTGATFSAGGFLQSGAGGTIPVIHLW